MNRESPGWDVMNKKVSIIICILLFLVGTAFFYGIILMNPDESTALKEEMSLQDEFASENQPEAEEREMIYDPPVKNPDYELFYGEWEISETVYVDPVPTRGTEYTSQEVEEAKKYYYDNTEIRKIQFTPDEIVVNEKETYDEVTYTYVVFPADIDYHIHFTMTLRDIGLALDSASYYLFVRAESGGTDKVAEFFVKDPDTIIVCYDGLYCVEYTKVSEVGNSPEIIMILG